MSLTSKYSTSFHLFSEQFYENNWRSLNFSSDLLNQFQFLNINNNSLFNSPNNNDNNNHIINNNNDIEKQFGFHKEIYRSLKSIHDGEISNFNKSIKRIRLNIIRSLQFTSLENTKSVYPVLSQLRFIGEIEKIWQSKNSSDFSSIVHSIRYFTANSFDLYEPLLSLRSVLFL